MVQFNSTSYELPKSNQVVKEGIIPKSLSTQVLIYGYIMSLSPQIRNLDPEPGQFSVSPAPPRGRDGSLIPTPNKATES